MQTYDIKSSTKLFRLLIGDTAEVQLVGSCAKSWHITSYEWHCLWENCFRFADERESLYHCMIVVLSWVRLEYITGLAPDNTEFQSAWSLSPPTEDTVYRIHSPALLREVRVSISASKSSIRRFEITEKAPTRAFSWLKAPTSAFTFKTLLRVG